MATELNLISSSSNDNYDDYYGGWYAASSDSDSGIDLKNNLTNLTLVNNVASMTTATTLNDIFNISNSPITNDTSYLDNSSSFYSLSDDNFDIDAAANFNLFTDLATILTALFYGSAFVLGTIGNGLIIYIVAHYQRMRTLSNVFLASLAIADLLLVCVCIPIKFVQLITYTWTFGLVMCKAIHYVQSLSAYCSVLTLTIISVERYYAIIHPVQCRATFSMRHIRKMICLTWILSAILASPSIGVYMLERIGDETMDHFWCVKIDSEWATMDNPDLRQRWFEARVIYEVYQIMTILALPTLVMIFTYSRICTHLWTVFHHRTAMRFGHACHFMSSSSTASACIVPGTTSSSSGIFSNSANTSAGAGGGNGPAGGSSSIFTSSMSSTSTTITMANNQPPGQQSRDSILLQQDSLQESGQPPPTPTSLISVQSSLCSAYFNHTNPSNGRTKHYQPNTNNLCHLKTSDEDNQTVKQVIKMLVAVVALFVLCWAPTLVIGLLRAFNIIAETNEGILKEIITVTFLLSYLNSVINPIIYGFMSKNFRLYFRLIFNQFWSMLTNNGGDGGGRCTNCNNNSNSVPSCTKHHNHHNHHRYQNGNYRQPLHHQQQTQQHRINSLNQIRANNNFETEIANIEPLTPNSDNLVVMVGGRDFRRNTRQSWEFSSNMQPHPTTTPSATTNNQHLPPVMIKKLKMQQQQQANRTANFTLDTRI